MSDDEKKNVVDLSDFDTGEEVTKETEDSEADDGATDPLTAIRELRLALEKAEKDLMYMRADFDNYKKSAIKERSQLIKFGNERLLVDLLSVIDNFEHALNMEISEENVQSFREGVEMIKNELHNHLAKHGLERVESLGKAFDPNVHEALSSESSQDVEPGHVSQVFKDAYKLHDRVIRPAQVVVAKEADGSDEQE